MKQGKHSAHCLTHSKHLLHGSAVATMVVTIIISTGEWGVGGKQSKPAGEGFRCFSFIISLPLRSLQMAVTLASKFLGSISPTQTGNGQLQLQEQQREGSRGWGWGWEGEREKLCHPRKHAPWAPPRSPPCGPSTGPACFLPSHMVLISECNRQLLATGSSY